MRTNRDRVGNVREHPMGLHFRRVAGRAVAADVDCRRAEERSLRVPCRDGIRHSPAEYSKPSDAALGVQVILNAAADARTVTTAGSPLCKVPRAAGNDCGLFSRDRGEPMTSHHVPECGEVGLTAGSGVDDRLHLTEVVGAEDARGDDRERRRVDVTGVGE